jgi:hypothetical protein
MTAREVGGYFELELPDYGGFLHDDGVLLNSGRNALEYVLMALGDVKCIYVPYYTCDVVLEPIQKHNIPCSFYHINKKLELDNFPSLNNGEYLIYTNYFGIKDRYVRRLADLYGIQLIVDNAQAWFAEPIKGLGAIYSPRKYVGLPDGGVAYCKKPIDESFFDQDVSFERCSHLLKRIDLGPSEGYADFKENSKQLVGQPIKRMSMLTKKMLSSIANEMVYDKRRKNFEFLHSCLKNTNRFEMPSMDSFACPMVYPYLTDDLSLRQRLIDNNVFVATYWPNVREWAPEGALERKLMDRLIPIPCDQRYGEKEMSNIVSLVLGTK